MAVSADVDLIRQQGGNRWLALWAVAACVGVYALAQFGLVLSEYGAAMLNDSAWWLACSAAALSCWHVAGQVESREKLAWRMLSAACLFWLAGHSVWSWYELVAGGLPAFPHWMQTLFSVYDWCFVAGLLLLPKPSASPVTPRHVGNLMLLVCTLAVVFTITLFEPARLPNLAIGAVVFVGLHCVGLAAMFVVAVYLVWSHSWRGLYWPLILLVCGAGVHLATFVLFAHRMITQTYGANDWFNVSWVVIFGAYAAAAWERAWSLSQSPSHRRSRALHRERWLEALIPALLIALVLLVAWFYRDWITPRVAWTVLCLGLVFAVALGIREAWVQKQEQNLLASLSDANERMTTANLDLSQSESRYRSLSAELEARVASRTAELQEAYGELENFSYHVAHDLKAPLRAVNGFGAILVEECGPRLDEKGREYVRRMQDGSLRMARLIDDLLAYARVERRTYERRAVRLRALIERVISEHRDEIAQRGVHLTVDVADITASADQEGLMIACRNLLQNALKFSCLDQPAEIRICAREDRNDVIVEFHDNGVGFDMKHERRIFDMFERLNGASEQTPGTGIGLALVRKAVERMKGRVWAESAPGAGSTFYVLLQRA